MVADAFFPGQPQEGEVEAELKHVIMNINTCIKKENLLTVYKVGKSGTQELDAAILHSLLQGMEQREPEPQNYTKSSYATFDRILYINLYILVILGNFSRTFARSPSLKVKKVEIKTSLPSGPFLKVRNLARLTVFVFRPSIFVR